MNQSKDASQLLACQLKPNPDYLSEADFIKPDGKYRDHKVVITAVTIEEIVNLSESDCLLKLIRPGEPDVLVARITQRSRSQLELSAGMSVFARVKGVAVLD